MTQKPLGVPHSGTPASTTSTHWRVSAEGRNALLRRQLRAARRCLVAGRLVGLLALGVSLGLTLEGNRLAVFAVAIGAFTLGISYPAQLYLTQLQLRADNIRDDWEIPHG